MQKFCVGTFYAKPGFVVLCLASLTLFIERVSIRLAHKGLAPVHFHLFPRTGLKRGVRRGKKGTRKIGISIRKSYLHSKIKGVNKGD